MIVGGENYDIREKYVFLVVAFHSLVCFTRLWITLECRVLAVMVYYGRVYSHIDA